MLLATCVSLGTAFILEYANPSFRTPTEVYSELSIPVLAAVPHEFSAFSGASGGNGNGNGNHNGNGNGDGTRQSVFAGRDTTID
jgi:hypothetical protein